MVIMNPPPNPRLCMLTSPLHIRAARAASTADPFCSKMFLKETPVFYLSFSLVKETDRLIATSRVRVTEFKNSRARVRNVLADDSARRSIRANGAAFKGP